MAYANGRLPTSLLTTVEPKTKLLKRDAPCYFAFRMYAADRRRTLSIAGAGKGGGGGYRTFTMQDQMHRASRGNAALAALYGLNPRSSVPLAAAGYSSHGKPDQARLDLVGTDLSWIVDHASTFGMTREFGAADPNHFLVTGPKANTWRHTVGKTASNITGRPGAQLSNFYRRLQLLARLGGYRGPVDGELGDSSYHGLRSELEVAVGIVGSSRAELIVALQVWAGVSRSSTTRTDDFRKIAAANVRKIATKLNRL